MNTPAVVRGPGIYLSVLETAFALFNSARLVAYLPTLWLTWRSGASDQHSLWTWFAWLGANLTMSAWLFERNGRRLDRAVLVNASNALMCALQFGLIVVMRL